MSQLSLFEYFGVAARSVEKEKMKSQKYVHDVGEELLGARKHTSNNGYFSGPELETDPSTAYELCCKNEILKDFDYRELRIKGFSSETAYAIKLILDRVSQRPEDSPVARRGFIKGMAELRGILLEAKDKSDLEIVIQAIRENLRMARMTASTCEPIDRYWLTLGTRFRSLFLGTRSTRPRYNELIKKAFSEEGQEWKWLEKKQTTGERKNRSEVWIRKVPDEVIRLSQEESGVSKPEDLQRVFGFRGVQFGNWVTDDSGKYHVLCCGSALTDLVSFLQIPPKAVTFFGRLGIAFGARGSGAALAHYEPRSNIMNITKIRGGGSLCHELAHALDWNLYSYSHQFTNGKKLSITGNKPGLYLPPEVGRAVKVLMKEIKEGEGLKREIIPNPLPTESKAYVTGVVNRLKQHNYDINATLVSLKHSSYRISSRAWKDIALLYCNMLEREGKKIPSEVLIPSDESNYLLASKQLGAYWKRDHELFARAFESWIEDELQAAGKTNSYLVAGTQCSGPYPSGYERETINEAFREFWKAIQNSGILSTSNAWISK
ncbi:LPD1 domain-containing protein [Paenibacillus illinoisensis]|uniref:LPD1 domain-containing protein n=1 Tax=Paenibacillus illinoisensis TaxID=59845 RepID=UPI00301C640E